MFRKIIFTIEFKRLERRLNINAELLPKSLRMTNNESRLYTSMLNEFGLVFDKACDAIMNNIYDQYIIVDMKNYIRDHNRFIKPLYKKYC